MLSDSDSSVAFSDVEASPYSGGAAFDQPAFAGLDTTFLDTTVAPTGCSSPLVLETKWQHGRTQYPFPFDSYKACTGYGFTEEWLASSDLIGSDGGTTGFFSEDHASSLNFNWCPSGIQGWE
jgi:homeobox-leucine zipper protein